MLVCRLAMSAALLGSCERGHADARASTIVVDGYLNHEVVHAWVKTQRRQPTRDELLTIHQVWIDNEVLFREGSKGPRKGAAPPTREQAISSALTAIKAQVGPALPNDEELRAWFENHRDKYEQPARFDFEDAVPTGDSSEDAVRSLVDRLNRGAVVEPQPSLRVFKGRPRSNLMQSYGAEAATALATSRPGIWVALRVGDGWRAMRLTALSPARTGSFDAERDAVLRDWSEATLAERRNAALRSLWKKYEIEFEPAHDCLADK
jgi:hypothetical protein